MDPTFRNNSAIDVADTRDATKALFIHNTFPTTPADGTGWNFGSILPTPAEDWSIDEVNGVLVLAPTGATTPYAGLPVQVMTCGYSASTASNYVGEAFGPGYYVTVNMAESDSARTNTDSWNIFWTVGLQMLTGGSGAAYHTAEMDVKEAFGGGGLAGWGYHDWTGVGVGVTWRDDLGAPFNDFVTAGVFEEAAISVQPAQNNDGVTGIVKFYMDDVEQSSPLNYTTTAPSSPAPGGGGHNGNFSSLNTQKDCFAAASGAGQYNKIAHWRVYTR